jgi:hypothetical protein
MMRGDNATNRTKTIKLTDEAYIRHERHIRISAESEEHLPPAENAMVAAPHPQGSSDVNAQGVVEAIDPSGSRQTDSEVAPCHALHG